MFANRILSGMRPTGSLHLGHYHGVIKNWVELQSKFECYFFVADWHALTTGADKSENIAASTREMVLDWLATPFRAQLTSVNCCALEAKPKVAIQSANSVDK